MPDIFDELQTSTQGGDIFDQVAASVPQKGIFARAMENLPGSIARAISNAPGVPVKATGTTKKKTLKGFGGKTIEFEDIEPPSPMEEIKGIASGIKEAFNPATAPERFAEDPVGTVLIPASMMAGAARGVAASPRMSSGFREAAAEATAPASPSIIYRGHKLEVPINVPKSVAYGLTGSAVGHYYAGTPGAIVGGVGGVAHPIVKGFVRGFRQAGQESEAARAARLANMESQINWKPPSPPPQIIEATAESVAPAQPLVSLDELAKGYGFKSFEKAPPADQAKLMAAHNALVRKSAPPPSSAPAEAYGGTVRNGVIYDEQGAPVAYQEGSAPKEAKPPMPSRTEGAPTLHNEPLAHQQGVEGGTIQGYLTRVNDIKLGRFLSDKGISPEQVRTMPEDQLNTLIKEHNPKAKPLGKSGTFGRTVEAKREDLAKRIENVQKLTPEQYQKKLEDATREYQEQLNKAKGRGKEGRREVSKLQSIPFVPPPPVMA